MAFFLKRVLVAASLSLVLGGRSVLKVLELSVPHDARIESDIAYGEIPRQKLDVFVPKDGAATEKRPVVLFFYGGGWRSGSRAEYRFAGEALAKLGFVAVVADYRLYPEATFPAFQTDGAKALRWTKDHAAAYGGDPNAIFLMGHSAGAHLAALLALDPTYDRAAGVPDGTIKGVIGLAGPYAMVPSQIPYVREAFTGGDGKPLADESVTQPVKFVTKDAPTPIPPMLLLYGLQDRRVERGHAVELTRLLQAAGRPVTLKEYPNLGHPGILLALMPMFSARTTVLQDVRAFITAVATP